MSQTALYSEVVRVAGGSGPARLSSICNSARWPAEGAFLPAAAQGFLQDPIENHPSGFSPQMDDVGLSWDWVVDTIDGEDNRGQGIDHKT